LPRGALIVNPSATRVTPELAAAVEHELAATGSVETLLTERAGHAVALAAEAAERCESLYVFSGDGTFNEVVNGLRADVPVGFIPGGGTSVLPRALGLPRDPVECARILAATGATRRISLGRVETSPPLELLAGLAGAGRRFTFSAGLGLDAELVRAVDHRGRAAGRRPGDLAFAVALARILLRRRGRLDPALTVLGRGRAAFALVANCDPYTYAGRAPLHVAPEARFELGLDLVAPVELRPRRLSQAAFSILARPTHPRADWIVYAHDADEIRIECDRPTPLQLDGEDVGDVTDAVFRAERGALRTLVSEIIEG
jgi:diacylglycerol kinase family enzyme